MGRRQRRGRSRGVQRAASAGLQEHRASRANAYAGRECRGLGGTDGLLSPIQWGAQNNRVLTLFSSGPAQLAPCRCEGWSARCHYPI